MDRSTTYPTLRPFSTTRILIDIKGASYEPLDYLWYMTAFCGPLDSFLNINVFRGHQIIDCV